MGQGTMNNHRHNKRIKTDEKLDVLLYRNSMPVASGTVGNLSVGGAFIETDYRPKDMAKRYIEFEFASGNGTALGDNRIKALIIHYSQKGFGLMTGGLDSLSRIIRQQLNISK